VTGYLSQGIDILIVFDFVEKYIILHEGYELTPVSWAIKSENLRQSQICCAGK